MTAWHWVFPPPATPSFLPSTSLNLDFDTRILTYLNTSATNAPSSGFGYAPTYHADTMDITWPNGDYVSRNRAWHCMPCSLTINFTSEWMNWDACRYDSGEDLPELYSLTFLVSTSTDASSSGAWSLNHVPRLPEFTRDQSLLCAFGIPNTNPYELSAAFRFINRDRKQTTGENMYIFNASAPAGNPLYIPPPPTEDELRDRERRRGQFRQSVGVIVGFVVLAVVVMAVGVWGLVCCVKRRKAGKGAKKESRDLAMAKDEEARAEALPTYEGPPAYNEAVHEGGGK